MTRLLLSLSVLMLLFTGCSPSPLKIGFVATLSGRYSQLGVSSRDGFLLAVEEINQIGGFDGRPVDVLIGNDRNDVATCIATMKEQIDSGAVLIFASLTSRMVPAVGAMASSEVPLISPTVSTGNLTGIDDNFIRFIPDAGRQGRFTAELMKKHGIRQAGLVVDQSNPDYTNEVARSFVKSFSDENHRIIDTYGFQSLDPLSLHSSFPGMMSVFPEAFFLVASGADSSHVAQSLRKAGYSGWLFGSQWTRTDELINQGGRAVEGMLVLDSYSLQSQSPKYQKFTNAYRNRYGTETDFGAAAGYETAMLLFEVINELKRIDTKALKSATINRTYNGLQGEIVIDEFGDAEREYGVAVIENEHFMDYQSPD